MFTLGATTQKTNDWTMYLDTGRKITETCYEMYKQSKTGLGGESAQITNGKIDMRDRRVSLRPEVIESLFYQYRLTKDEKFRSYGKDIMEAMDRYCKASEGGYHSLEENGSPSDRMESFFLAETLKYLYLLYSDDSVIPLDQYVLNTEAHPLSIRGFNRRKDASKWVKIK
jgi:mannosyl-oligosaccharide alpha-1,2-mannosidase